MPESIHAEFLASRRSASPKCLVDPAPEGDELRAIRSAPRTATAPPARGPACGWRSSGHHVVLGLRMVRPERHPHRVAQLRAVCMNLLHACRAHGYGAVWLTGWAAEHPLVRAHLEIEGHERVAGFVHIGTETDPRDDRERPDVGAITTVRGGNQPRTK